MSSSNRRRRERNPLRGHVISNGHPHPPAQPAQGPPPAPQSPAGPSFLVLGGLGLLIFVVGGVLALVAMRVLPMLVEPATPPSNRRGSGAMVQSEARALLDRFLALRKENNPEAWQLVEAPTVDLAQPLSEPEAEAVQADDFLRSDLAVVKVLPGEPVGGGKQKQVVGYFTLMMRGGVTGPLLSVREGDRVLPPTRRVMLSPDLVVEVRGGKIRPIRPQLHEGRDPQP